MKKSIVSVLLFFFLFTLSGCSVQPVEPTNSSTIPPKEVIVNQNTSQKETPKEDKNNVVDKPTSQDKTTPDVKQEQPKIPETPKAEEPKKEEVLLVKKGDTGDKVTEIQTRLKEYGYSISIDGDYGNETYFAITDFQSRIGLTPDGVVGPITMSKLNEQPTAKTMYKPAPNVSLKSKEEKENFINGIEAYSKTNYYIFVDLKSHTVNIFQGSNHNWKLIKEFKATVGAPETPTIKGHYEVGIKGDMFRVNANIICKYYTQIKGNYLFHTVLLDNKGNVVDGRLGYNISHGCIRLAVENAKYIYNNIPTDTHIWIK